VIPDFPLSFGGLVPAHFTPEIAIAYAHRVWALVTFVAVVAASVSALRTAGKRAELASPAILMLILVTAQVTLGAFIIWTQRQVHVTTTHVVTAAILLAVSLVLTARSWHALRLPRTAPETLTSREGAIGYGKAPA
jgi:cytochrome c oxidase assembly protein subunit 15